MGIPEADKKYTYEDYIAWEGRWELINGTPYLMTPSPSVEHQRVSGRIFAQLFNHLEGEQCEVFSAPIDVYLAGKIEKGNEIHQPDITVVCDPNKIVKQGIVGAPDLIVEVLSPGSAAKRDKVIKFNAYQKYGVCEYWIVDPLNQLVDVFILDSDGQYSNKHLYTIEDEIIPHVLESMTIKMSTLF